jgi:hypothetical protein
LFACCEITNITVQCTPGETLKVSLASQDE